MKNPQLLLQLLLLTSAALLWLCTAALGPFHTIPVRCGDGSDWDPDVNYTELASADVFFVGDLLDFLWAKKVPDLMLVDEAAYNRCDTDRPIEHLCSHHGTKTCMFHLNRTGAFYFLCSSSSDETCGGLRQEGMKLAINVLPERLRPYSPCASSPPFAFYITYCIILSLLILIVVVLDIVPLAESHRAEQEKQQPKSEDDGRRETAPKVLLFFFCPLVFLIVILAPIFVLF